MKKILIPALLVLISCNTERIEEHFLHAVEKDLLDDEVILAGVSSLDYHDGKFLVTEFDYNRFYILAENFRSLKELGEAQSPNFPSYPTDANYVGGDIWVYSSEMRSIQRFDESRVVQSISVDSDTELKNFDVNKDQILFSRVSFDGKPFVLHDLNTSERQYFGKYFKDRGSPFFNHYFLDSYSFIIDTGYLFVLPYIGVIQKYNHSFELIGEFNLMNQKGLSLARDWLNAQYGASDNSLISMFTDCQVVDDRLLLLAYNRTPNASVNPRYVYEIDLSNELELKAKYTLGSKDDYFTKFTHINGNKFAFFESQTSRIQYFEFPD